MKGFTDRVRIDVALILLPRSLSISPRSRHHSHPPSPPTFSLRRSIFVVVSLVTFTTTVEDTATADLGGSLVVLVSQKVCAGVYKDVTTTQLDELAAETAAAMTANHPDYTSLAARIDVSNLHKNTKKSFSETMPTRLVSEIIYDRDFEYDYFGFKTLERSYLLKVHGKVVERPQHMLMRVSVGIHKEDIDSAIQTYQLMSQRWFTHASPTLFNPGTPTVQLSSCFLICMKDDSGLRFMISSKMGLAKTCMINSLLMEKTRINEH
ncbi:hypothetical protein Bca101_061931 [Brassica carinata]